MSVWDEVIAEYACAHVQQEVRASVASNGMRQIRLQCLRCGELSTFLKKTDPLVIAAGSELPDVDLALREAWNQALRDEVTRRLDEQRELASAEWWGDYAGYLQSPEWHERRALVLARDDYLCQACLRNGASQVHHLNYDHVGNEPLFELIAICEACHERLTQLDRERRAALVRSPL